MCWFQGETRELIRLLVVAKCGCWNERTGLKCSLRLKVEASRPSAVEEGRLDRPGWVERVLEEQQMADSWWSRADRWLWRTKMQNILTRKPRVPLCENSGLRRVELAIEAGLNSVQPLQYCGCEFYHFASRGISMLCPSDEIRRDFQEQVWSAVWGWSDKIKSCYMLERSG